MHKRVFSFLSSAFLLSAVVAPAFSNPATRNVKRAKSNQLVAMLPASDGVATIDVKRFFGEALPVVLASNQPLLSKTLAKVDSMREKTGIDLRQFEFVTVGFNARHISGKSYEVEPVAIARGAVSSSAVILAAKEAAGNRYKEETVAGKIMYLFPAKDIAERSKPTADAGSGTQTGLYESFLGKMSSEVAVTAIDPNTVAFGFPDRVRQVLEAKTRVGKDVLSLLDRKPFSVLNFASKVPSGMSAFLPLENDDLGNSIESIRYAFGNIEVGNGQVNMGLTAKTERSAQAEQLYDLLDVLQTFGKAALGKSTRADQQLYARLIERLKLGRIGAEVSLDLTIPQNDLDQLMAILTKSK